MDREGIHCVEREGGVTEVTGGRIIKVEEFSEASNDGCV